MHVVCTLTHRLSDAYLRRGSSAQQRAAELSVRPPLALCRFFLHTPGLQMLMML